MALFCDTVLMNQKVHCAPVLENHHFSARPDANLNISVGLQLKEEWFAHS
jgi:hypothetical protein